MAPMVLSAGLAADRTDTPFAVSGRRIAIQALNLVSVGHGVFAGDDQREVAVAAGDLLALPSNGWHRFAPTPGTAWTEWWVVYDPTQVAARLGRQLLPPAGRLAGAGRDALQRFETLHGLWLTRPPGWQERADAELHQLLVEVWLRLTGRLAPARDDIIGRACGWLQAGLDDPGRDLGLFARREGLSSERLRKRFRAALGVPPGAWLLQLRLRAAQNLLSVGPLRISEVAKRCGFSDPFHFSRMFRRHTGCSPLAWRHRGLNATGLVAPRGGRGTGRRTS